MADHHKFERTALYLLPRLDEFDGVITNSALAKHKADALRRDGISLSLA